MTPKKCRDEIIRRAQAGESYKSIADSMGFSIGGVRYQCQKAGVNSHHKKIGSEGESMKVEIRGETLTLEQAAKKYGIHRNTLRCRYMKGKRGDQLLRRSHHCGREFYELGLSEEEWKIYAALARDLGLYKARSKSGIPFAALHAAIKGEWHRLG